MLNGKILHVLLLLILSSGLFTSTGKSARILSIIPFPMKSHNMLYRPLLLELARRGHNVTSVGAYPSIDIDRHLLKNFNEIIFQSEYIDFFRNLDYYEIKKDTSLWNVGWGDLFLFWEVTDNYVQDIYKNPRVEKLIKSKSEKFDLIICEGFFGFESLFAFGQLYRAPVIAVASFGNSIYINPHIGNPIGSAYHPSFLLPYTDKMTLFQRLYNLLLNLYVIITNDLFHIPNQERLVKKYFGEAIGPMPPLKEMLADVSMVFLNTHDILGFARPNLPNIIHVGGLHIQPTGNSTKIDKDLQEMMDKAEQGVIYFSFGSNVNLAKMPKLYKRAFIESFSKIPQLVLWKWEDTNLTFPGQTENIHISRWYPQQQVLEHKNCMAFITHGGLLSLEEAAYNAVPVIGVPFFGDQPMNMKRVEEINFGILLEYDNITMESVSWALNEIIKNKKYKENAKKISSIFRDEYGNGSALQRAVYWVEYTLKYDGAPHLRSTARLLPWYKYLMLDAILLILCFVYMIYLILKLLVNKTLKSRKSRAVDKTKKTK